MCSHFNAIRYWVDSLQPPYERYFPSYNCHSWEDFTHSKCRGNAVSFMGIAANRQAHGKFFIKLKSSHRLDAKQLYSFVLERISQRLVNIINLDF
jgi:Lipase